MAAKSKTAKHTTKPAKKPLSITKHASVLGKLGGRPKKDLYDKR